MRFCRFTLITAFVLALFITAALVIGRAQPSSDYVVLLHLDTCARPCWIGIRPGVTTLDEAYRRVKQVFAEPRYQLSGAQGNYTVRDSKDDRLVFSVQVYSNPSLLVDSILLQLDRVYVDGHWVPNQKAFLTFADLNRLWGSPMYIRVWSCYGDWLPYYDAVQVTHVVVAPPEGFPDANARANWNSPVRSIQMFGDQWQMADYTMFRRWRGFLSYRQYGYRDYGLDEDRTC